MSGTVVTVTITGGTSGGAFVPLSGTTAASPVTGPIRTTNDIGVWKQYTGVDDETKTLTTGVIEGTTTTPSSTLAQAIHKGYVARYYDGEIETTVEIGQSSLESRSYVDLGSFSISAKIYAESIGVVNQGYGFSKIVVDASQGLLGLADYSASYTANHFVQKTYVDSQVATKFTLPTFTSGSVLFSSGTTIAQDNANFFWNNTTKSLGIGTNTNVPTSILTLSSTTKGFLPPRMTTTQRNAISSPPAGLEVFDSTTNVPNFYNGESWINNGGGVYRTAVTTVGTSHNIISGKTRPVKRLIFTGSTGGSGTVTIPLTGYSPELILNLTGTFVLDANFTVPLPYSNFGYSDGDITSTNVNISYRPGTNSIQISALGTYAGSSTAINSTSVAIIEFQEN